jgi:transcriptional regulator with XRE-family HTH domain
VRFKDVEGARSLGLALLLLRRSRDMAPKVLAQAAAVTRASLSRYETGRALPQFATLQRIIRALDFPMSTLYEAQILADHLIAPETAADDILAPGRPEPESTRRPYGWRGKRARRSPTAAWPSWSNKPAAGRPPPNPKRRNGGRHETT